LTWCLLEQTGIKFSFGIALVSQTPLFRHIFGIADRWLRRTEALQQPPAGTHQTTSQLPECLAGQRAAAPKPSIPAMDGLRCAGQQLVVESRRHRLRSHGRPECRFAQRNADLGLRHAIVTHDDGSVASDGQPQHPQAGLVGHAIESPLERSPDQRRTPRFAEQDERQPQVRGVDTPDYHLALVSAKSWSAPTLSR